MDRARVANGQRGPARRGVQAPPGASAPARRESFREHRVKIPAATSGQEMHCDAPFFMRASACRNCKTRRPAKLKRASEAKKGGSECTHSAPTALDGRRYIADTDFFCLFVAVFTAPRPAVLWRTSGSGGVHFPVSGQPKPLPHGMGGAQEPLSWAQFG